jgi:hypothetical protein
MLGECTKEGSLVTVVRIELAAQGWKARMPLLKHMQAPSMAKAVRVTPCSTCNACN